MATFTSITDPPTTLLSLLSNSLVLRNTTPYIPLSSINALAGTCKSFRELLNVTQTRDVFRNLDLSRVKTADVKETGPIDSGGINWRAERMDEALTEDEFYCGPLRGIFSKLQRRNVLTHVQTLILDGLCVPADLVQQIIAEDRFNVRILSIRDAKHLNERKLMQALTYAVRPTRPKGTPRLKGLYVFGPMEPQPKKERSKSTSSNPSVGVTGPSGPPIATQLNERSAIALENSIGADPSRDKWYFPSGRVFNKKKASEWASTLQICEGIIAFDAVLCRGPRHDPARATTFSTASSTGNSRPLSYLPPAVANVALGPAGCAACKSTPESSIIWGEAPSHQFPLLSPPPLQGSTVRAAQMPSNVHERPRLIARCEDCLRGRWCERCNLWWDEPCYSGHGLQLMTFMQQREEIEQMQPTKPGAKKIEEAKMGVKRECFGCGPNCGKCIAEYIRPCNRCRNEYCVLDNDGSSSTHCDWCHKTARRTKHLY